MALLHSPFAVSHSSGAWVRRRRKVAPGADDGKVRWAYFRLFAAAVAGAVLPWLGLGLLTALQAGAPQVWLLQAGVFFCWAVIGVQWSLVLMLLLLVIGLKAKHADGLPLARH